MVVDAAGQFMTQRQWPAMALIRTALTAHALRLSAPGMADLDVALDGSGLHGEALSVGVWSDTTTARRESEAAAQWLSQFLQTPCGLLKVDAAARRVTGPLAADLALSLREAMSNIVRHAKASAVVLTVKVADGRVVVSVADDGVGIQSDRRSGLQNLGERARAHGGTFTFESEVGEGTTLVWDMPLPPSL